MHIPGQLHKWAVAVRKTAEDRTNRSPERVGLHKDRDQGRTSWSAIAWRLLVLLTFVPRGSSLDLYSVLGVIVLFAMGLGLAQFRRH